ncbi:MAG: hypothetical protein QNJ46_23400 [Leptolyngbyaceae cyanobacterium MO_188.B28]|nr:hypothetical protein [Leptolyngbyaceae cyanobacterium MO_188.B28]
MKRFFQVGASLTAIILGAGQSDKAEAFALDFGLPADASTTASGEASTEARAWEEELAVSFAPSPAPVTPPLSPSNSFDIPGLPSPSNPPRVRQNAATPLQHQHWKISVDKAAAPPSFKPDQATASTNLFTGDADSLVARAVGSAEGTRTPEGGYTAAYYGHRDPGNGAWNLGSFSYQHGARSPEEADEKQLNRLKIQAASLKQQAEHKGLTLSLQEELNGIDLANQAPLAALDRGYIDWLNQARQLHMAEDEGVLWARTRSFLDPDTGRWNAPGLGNTVHSISQDQDRRQRAISRAISVYKRRETDSMRLAMATPSAPPPEPTATKRERVDFFLSMDFE